MRPIIFSVPTLKQLCSIDVKCEFSKYTYVLLLEEFDSENFKTVEMKKPQLQANSEIYAVEE